VVYTSNDDAVAAQTAAAFYMIKAGAAPETTYALTGRLYVTSENWALLSVPNAVVRGLFDAMSEPGIELPPGRPNFNAHITVLRPTDIELIGGAAKVTERGHSFKYQLGPVTTIEPTGWKDVSRCWMVQIRSPELEAFRKSYGLSALPAGDHPFHLTIAVRKKNVLRPNTVSKAASETLRPHYKEARLISLADLDEAAARAHQSPSDAQKDAGNYAKGHVSIHGMPVSIEVAKGNMRSGVTKDGRAWSVTMPAHYGYFKGTVGSDGDHVDVFIGEHPESGFVLVVNQVDPETRTFDEHKVIVGTRNAAEAKALYLSGYEKGWKGMGATTTMTVDQLRAWLTKGNTKKPVKPLTVKTADSSACPKCGGSSDVYCHCQMTHRDYACGYDWHTCSIHGPGSPGTGKGKDPNKCTCDAQKKRASADLCPVCGEEHVMTCRCRLGNKRCANNHEWHNCAVHGPGSPGSGHGKGGGSGACSCDVTEKDAALAATFTANKTYDAICPHCKEVIREKSTLMDPETGLMWHRPCRDKAPFEINWPKTAALKPDVTLQPHQKRIAESTGSKLLYHPLGSGKSLAAIAAAETEGKGYTALVPASLRGNFEKEREKFTDLKTPAAIVSHTAAALGRVPADSPMSTLIVDEAHRARTPGTALHNSIDELTTKADRTLLLTGSPIVNRPGDLGALLSMVGADVPRHPDRFEARYLHQPVPEARSWFGKVKPLPPPSIANREELVERLAGKVDYVPPASPKVTRTDEHIDVPLQWHEQQKNDVLAARLSNKRVLRDLASQSHSLSPQEIQRMRAFLTGARQVGLAGLRESDPLSAFQGSSKLQAAKQRLDAELANPQSKALVFSNFVDTGVKPYAAALERENVPHGVFHGGLSDEERKTAVERYNNDKHRVMLLGPSGMEGLSFKGTRLVQLLDKHWNDQRDDQASGRAIRFDSHDHMPDVDRDVRVEHYAAKRHAQGKAPTADEILARIAKEKTERAQPFLELLREVGTPETQEKQAGKIGDVFRNAAGLRSNQGFFGTKNTPGGILGRIAATAKNTAKVTAFPNYPGLHRPGDEIAQIAANKAMGLDRLANGVPARTLDRTRTFAGNALRGAGLATYPGTALKIMREGPKVPVNAVMDATGMADANGVPSENYPAYIASLDRSARVMPDYGIAAARSFLGGGDQSAFAQLHNEIGRKAALPLMQYHIGHAREVSPVQYAAIDALRSTTPMGLMATLGLRAVGTTQKPPMDDIVRDAVTKYAPAIKADPVGTVNSPHFHYWQRTFTSPEMIDRALQIAENKVPVNPESPLGKAIAANPNTFSAVNKATHDASAFAANPQTLANTIEAHSRNLAANPKIQAGAAGVGGLLGAGVGYGIGSMIAPDRERDSREKRDQNTWLRRGIAGTAGVGSALAVPWLLKNYVPAAAGGAVRSTIDSVQKATS